MNQLRSLLILLSRICLSVLFLWAGVAKVLNWHGTVAYMASKDMPWILFLLPAAIAAQLLGGLAILFGYYARWGAFLLILFIIPASIMFHDFWNINGMQRVTEMTMFMKDLAILGGLLQILAHGSGPYSLKSNIDS